MIRNWRVVLTALAVACAVSACGGSGQGGGAAKTAAQATGTGRPIATTGTPVRGGTAYWAEQPLTPPNYIFPLISGAYYTNENVFDFQTLIYRPLYWFGDRGTPAIDYAHVAG